MDDALEDFGTARVVPNALRIDDGDGPVRAYPQAIGLGTVNPPLTGKSQLVEAPLQVLPRLKSGMFVAALRLGLIAAKEDVPP